MTERYDYDRLIKRIETVEHQHGKDLTDSERDLLRQMIAAWRVWTSLGVVGRALIWVLMTAAGAAIAWQQLRDMIK